ncbi:rod shape-determining protein MreC [Aquibacillus halophilus]|uniref:Cell shape-determining protein MreC n=1 Tax=Aquibacillus halophilus TaxID=930132 RepID=A0A6A8DEN5_9BACI|nr:rod shape-determining protein MreC [Aquibacillus halophilus]MRH42976.1 rod shape-determining protein MreC [Aquibacillus halophilus]
MSFFHKKRLFVILVGFIILVGLIGFSIRDREELSLVEEFLHDTVGWFQSIVHKPVDFTTSLITNIEGMKNVYDENQVLKSRLSQSKNLLYEVQELKQENQELRSVLGKTESITDYQPIQASVIARSPEASSHQVKLNKGKQNGVRTNMAVITGEGMIGKVQSASQFTSTVLLLSGFDRSNRISVNIAADNEEEVTGFIVGFDPESEFLLLELNAYEVELNGEELVVSSGMGGVFPGDLEIGTIEEVTPDKYGLTQIAYVKPAADLSNMDHVIVVNRLAAQPEEDTSEEEEE